MPNFGQVARFNKIPATGFVPETSATAPASPVVGQLWVDTSVTPRLLKVWDGSAWAVNNVYAGTTAASYAAGNDSRLSDQRIPTDDSVTGGTAGAGVKIKAATITAANLAASLTDGTAGSKQIRAIGSGAGDVVAGNDARLSDARNPLANSVTDASVATGAAIAETKLALASDAAAGTASRRTLGFTGLAAMPGTARLDQLAAPTAAVSLNGQQINNLGAPVSANDAARLIDIQNSAAGLDAKPSVRTISTANVALTGLTTGTVVNGVTLATGDRVLLVGQTTATENGVYVVPASGTAARAADTITPNSTWFVEEGTANSDTAWWVTNNGAITLGTTALTISQFSGGAAYTAGAGLTLTGNSFSISATYAGQTSITTVGTLTAGSLGAGFTAVGLAQGGLGVDASSPAGATTARGSLNAAQRGYAATLGAVTAGTPLTVTHNLGTQDVIAQVRDASTNEYIYLDVINASTNTVTITSGIAFAANALRIVVLPVA